MNFSWQENKGKFFRRSILVVFLLFFIVAVVTLLFFIFSNTSNINKNIYNLEDAQLEKTAVNILDSFDEIAETNSYLSTIEPYVENFFLPDINYASYLLITDQMKSYLSLFNQISNIFLKTPMGQEITIKAGFPEIDFEKYEVGTLKNSKVCIVPERDVYSNIFFNFTSGNISHAKNDIYISVDSLALAQENLAYDSDKKEFLIDVNGNIISSCNMGQVGQNFASLYELSQFSLSKHQSEFTHDGHTYILSVRKLEDVDMYVVAVTNKDYYSAYRNSSIGITVLISVVILLVVMAVAFFLLQYFYRPIKNILKQMSQYQEITISKDINEVEYISKKFDQIYQNNLVLDEAATKALKDLRTWNTAALQAQICPHFLHNTLDAINWLAFEKLGKDNNISKAVHHMAYIMTLNMDITRMFCTISEEINITKRYIEIVDIRLNDKVDIIWDVDEGCLDCTIPRLCIQPLIENAVTHAFPESSTKNIISISIKPVARDVEISVEDNGMGISPYNLTKLRANIKSNNYNSKNIGLRNINQRCKIIYGDDYGITIRSVVDKGTKFTLRIPKDK